MTRPLRRLAEPGDEILAAGEFPLVRRDFETIAAMLYADARIHLAEHKAPLVVSRLARRIRALRLPGFAAYCALVAGPQGEAERGELLCALTTNVTRFFREPHHFEHLRNAVLPALLARARGGGRVRLWSAACSTGPEPYSMAMTVLDAEPNAAALDIRILATDIDPRVVAEARAGVYPAGALDDAPAASRKRWFSRAPDGAWSAARELRKLIAFRTLNLNADWPMRGAFDVIFCRNVVIYFDEATQCALWSRFAATMSEGGHLYVGHSERLSGPAAELFGTVGVTTHRRNGIARP